MDIDRNTSEIVDFLRDFLGVEVGPDGDLWAEGGLDSVQISALMVFLEERFGVKIAGEEMTREALASPRQIAKLFTL